MQWRRHSVQNAGRDRAAVRPRPDVPRRRAGGQPGVAARPAASAPRCGKDVRRRDESTFGDCAADISPRAWGKPVHDLARFVGPAGLEELENDLRLPHVRIAADPCMASPSMSSLSAELASATRPSRRASLPYRFRIGHISWTSPAVAACPRARSSISSIASAPTVTCLEDERALESDRGPAASCTPCGASEKRSMRRERLVPLARADAPIYEVVLVNHTLWTSPSPARRALWLPRSGASARSRSPVAWYDPPEIRHRPAGDGALRPTSSSATSRSSTPRASPSATRAHPRVTSE